MGTRILNTESLTSHGNIEGRKTMVEILEAGLQAADPYNNTCKLLRIENGTLIVGGADFTPAGAPTTAPEVFDLDKIGRIFVVGAGKGVQRIAKALEDVLGDRLSGGHVIGKHGDPLECTRVGVTLAGHPVPDKYCAEGCRKILDLCTGLHADDLVFTIACNGVSSLLTLPAPGLTIDEVAAVTQVMQIERGVPTAELNAIRNHIDMMKGGRVSARMRPATAIHLLGVDGGSYAHLMHHNLWLHFLPDCITFADAAAMLTKWDAWSAVSPGVAAFIRWADPQWETIKAETFEKARFRIFSVMPEKLAHVPIAMQKAQELGFKPYRLATLLQAEAKDVGLVVAAIARTCEDRGEPFAPPCALFSTGELLVTVGQETGVGGRNQEYALSAALKIAGSKNIVMGGVDMDGSDGPGGHFADDADDLGIHCLTGGIVDGYTVAEAESQGVDINAAVKRHAASAALWTLKSGVAATQNIANADLDVTLILGRSG